MCHFFFSMQQPILTLTHCTPEKSIDSNSRTYLHYVGTAASVFVANVSSLSSIAANCVIL